VGLRLDYDTSVFRTTWLWGVYGGWRGHYVLLTEPGTSPPGGLAVNVADGNAAELGAGAVLETTVTVQHAQWAQNAADYDNLLAQKPVREALEALRAMF